MFPQIAQTSIRVCFFFSSPCSMLSFYACIWKKSVQWFENQTSLLSSPKADDFWSSCNWADSENRFVTAKFGWRTGSSVTLAATVGRLRCLTCCERPTFPLNLRSRGVKFELRSHKTQFQGFLEPQRGKQDAMCVSGLSIRVKCGVSWLWESRALFSILAPEHQVLVCGHTHTHTHLLTHHFTGVVLCMYSVEGF